MTKICFIKRKTKGVILIFKKLFFNFFIRIYKNILFLLNFFFNINKDFFFKIAQSISGDLILSAMTHLVAANTLAKTVPF